MVTTLDIRPKSPINARPLPYDADYAREVQRQSMPVTTHGETVVTLTIEEHERVQFAVLDMSTGQFTHAGAYFPGARFLLDDADAAWLAAHMNNAMRPGHRTYVQVPVITPHRATIED